MQRDIGRAVGSLRRDPMFSFVSVATIGLAVGANLAVASMILGLILTPLPFARADRLLFVQETNRGHTLSYVDARSLSQRIGTVAELALAKFDSRGYTDHGVGDVLHGGVVSANYFDVLGVQPELGRLFSAAFAPRNGIVISDEIWRAKFAANPAVLGKAVQLDRRSFSVVGVAPAHFVDPTPFGLVARSYWLPIDLRDPALLRPQQLDYTGVARVRDGVRTVVASEQISRLLTDVVHAHPLASPGLYSVSAAGTVREAMLGPITPLLSALYAAVALILLIACVNIANLTLSRNVRRENDLAIRSALGATHWRIARELTAEAAVISFAGTVAGLGIAALALRVIAPIASDVFPRWNNVRVSVPILAYSVVLLAAAAIAVGLLPALFRRRDAAAALIATTRATTGRLTNRVRAVLVVAEVAMAMTLVIGAALVLHSFLALTRVDLGFNPSDVSIAMGPNLTSDRYKSAPARAAFVREASTALSAIPGVTHVSGALQTPFLCCSSTSVSIPGRAAPPSPVLYNPVGPSYFGALQIPVIRGRNFNDADRAGAPCVVIVDESFAKHYFDTTEVIGRKVVQTATDENQRCTIVGVVGAVRQDFGSVQKPALYLSIAQDPEVQMFVVRTVAGISAAAAIRSTLKRVDPALPDPVVTRYSALFYERSGDARTKLLLFGALGFIALALALTGLYAVTAYSVEQRRREFAIRRALGARSRDVLLSVVMGALKISVLGTICGVIPAAVLSASLAEMLYQTSILDPTVLLGVVVCVVLLTLSSACLPALSAVRTSPAAALRSE